MIGLLWGLLIVLFIGGGHWFQSSIYSEPTAGLWWRGIVAATIMASFFALWAYLDQRPRGQYSSIFNFSATDDRDYDELRAVIVKNGKETPVSYRKRKTAQGQVEYRESTSPFRPLPRHPEAILVEENGQVVRFEPERDADKRLKVVSGQSLHYVDTSGRVMTEDMIGRVSTFRWDRFLPYALLNLLHFLLWFSCLWILLRFQWAHALGLSLVLWLIMTLLIGPIILNKVEEEARSLGALSTLGLHAATFAPWSRECA
jgi:hypothetical protein